MGLELKLIKLFHKEKEKKPNDSNFTSYNIPTYLCIPVYKLNDE